VKDHRRCYASQAESIRHWSVLLVCFAFLGVTPALRAGMPAVQFDVPPLIGCRDITTKEFAAANPGERLVEARLEISTLLGAGADNGLREYFFRVSSPGFRMHVADYQPKTTLASEFAGNISVEQRNEATKSAGLTVSGVWNQLVKISGSGDVGSKESTATRYELLAPMEPVTASGTIFRGSGVYFKLRPSRQTSLEGSRVFSLILRAPSSWRGDYLHVHCEATGVRRGIVRSLDEPTQSGVRDFFVGLYLAGDREAKALAERMVRAEEVLRRSLIQHREAIAEPSKTTFVDQLIAVWSPPPRGTAVVRQIEQLLFSAGNSSTVVPAGLPGKLENTLKVYLQARATLRSLS
jgi:hypothetical protein